MHPSRIGALAGPPAQLAGTIRTADEMNAGEEETSENLAKRQRVPRPPGGHLYPEHKWIEMHPVCFEHIHTRTLVYCFILASHHIEGAAADRYDQTGMETRWFNN